MSACRITRGRDIAPRIRVPPTLGARMRGILRPSRAGGAMAAAATAGTGPAAGVRWDLSDLYAGPDDPRIDADLDRARARAREFAARWRGKIDSLQASELAAAVDELESLQEPVARA